MNIESLHPILVHFPIALLSVYAVAECLRFKKIMAYPSWNAIKAFILIIGSFGSFAAFATGPEGSVAHAWSGFSTAETHALIDMHSTFAAITVFIFAVLAVLYIISLLAKTYSIPAPILKIASYGIKPYITLPLAIIGLVAVLVTGGLGGAIVYGPNVDPFVSAIYHLFF